ncbi:ankyrin repeat domain-containing protein [Candidatus Berkiella aquae]|uniref:Ankyrin repeat domain-containing protein n=1 Tax=Candidatus Berkiella aquae TaxID=295108 RepID=A0A0Q9YWI4_9GAMM|nr:ankyrin repeat domain-containing protein [Candidatus Berkiella aquae]MCS5710427.1 ankyrin repeat domain-containing protein [Candidatus Berkiella aquae]
MPKRSPPTLASLYSAIQKKDIDRVNALLSIPEIYENVHGNGNDILRLAVDKGEPRIVAMLLAIPAVRENAHLHNNEVLLRCAQNHEHELIRELLKIPTVSSNAHANANLLLHYAAHDGQIDLVTTLLALPHVQETAHVKNNEALRLAAQKGHTQIVQVLLAIPAVSANAHLVDNQILRVAIANNHYEIIQILLTIPAVKQSFQVKSNNELCHFVYAPVEFVLRLLEVESVKENAHKQSNEALYLAAQAGNIGMVNLLLAIPQVAKNAHAKNNRTLLIAAKNAHWEIVKALLLHPNVSQKMTNEILFEMLHPGFMFRSQLDVIMSLLENTNVQQGLMKVEGNNIIEFFVKFPNLTDVLIKTVLLNDKHLQCYLNMFVERPDTQILTQAILNVAIKESNVSVCKKLLAILSVRSSIQLNSLSLAAASGNIEIMKLLLTIPRINENAHSDNNYALRQAIINGHPAIVEILLMQPQVRARAHVSNNFVLNIAAQCRNVNIVKMLLTVPAVRKNVNVENNFILYKAASINLNGGIVKELLHIPEVKQQLFSDGDNHNLIRFFEKFPAYRSVVSETLTLYGVPLSWLLKDIASEEQVNCLKDFFHQPILYLEKQGASVSIIEAVRILYTEQLIANHKYQQAQRERNRERFNNVDDEQRIDAVRKHYLAIIKPHFQEKYERLRLYPIEIEIRMLLLNAMMEEAKEKSKDDSQMSRVIEYVDSLDSDTKRRLLFGSDEETMAQARTVFNSTQSEAQTAWRAYDPWAPVGGDWPNLLTPPLQNHHKAAFTVNSVGLEAPTTQTASDLVREMFAYSYLLVTDQEGTIEEQKLRETTFIAKVAETRRAHNQNAFSVDDPSCLPGSISRAGDTWIAHSKSVIPDVPQLLVEELRTLAIEKFQNLPRADQAKLFNALVMLSQYNAGDIIEGKANFSDEDVFLRQQFRDSLGNYGELYATLNQALQKRGSRALNQEEFELYVMALLMNIGGPWISHALADIYRKSKDESLENPYTYFLDANSIQSITKMQSITLLRPCFQSLSLENCNTLLLQTAEYLANGKFAEALSHLKENGLTQETLMRIEILIIDYQKAKEVTLKEKALLWDSLYHQFQYTPMRDMGVSLRNVVNNVVDGKQALTTALQDEHFPSEEVMLTKRKAKDDKTESTEADTVRLPKKRKGQVYR